MCARDVRQWKRVDMSGVVYESSSFSRPRHLELQPVPQEAEAVADERRDLRDGS